MITISISHSNCSGSFFASIYYSPKDLQTLIIKLMKGTNLKAFYSRKKVIFTIIYHFVRVAFRIMIMIMFCLLFVCSMNLIPIDDSHEAIVIQGKFTSFHAIIRATVINNLKLIKMFILLFNKLLD